MTKKIALMTFGVAVAGTSASATLLSAQMAGLNNANGTTPTGSSKTMVIIDRDGDGVSGFNLSNWNGGSFLPDPDDQIVTDSVSGAWSEATGDGDGLEALVGSLANAVLDTSTSPYNFTSVNAASNNASNAGEGDSVYLFYFPNLAIGAASPGLGRAYGFQKIGVLPHGNGSLTAAFLDGNDNRAFFTTGQAAVFGDTDGDGDIDNTDLGRAISNFTGPIGTAGGKNIIEGDTDGDGDVDNTDLGAAISGFTGPNPAPVPEPASLALIGLGGLCMLRRRRN